MASPRNERRHAGFTGPRRRRFERRLGRRHQHRLDAREAWIAGLRRLRRAVAEPGAHRCRRIDPELLQDRPGVGEGGRVGNRRAGGDDRGVVAGHIGDQQGDDARRRGDGKPATLNRGQVLAHTVHLGDVGAGAQQRPVDRLLVVEREALGGQRQQRRAAAGYQAQHQVRGAGAAHNLEDPPGRGDTGRVGHRMGGLDNLDRLARDRVTVAGDDETTRRGGPAGRRGMALDGPRHGGGRLAGTDDDDAAAIRWLGQVRRDAAGRVGRGDSRVEQAAQERPNGRGTAEIHRRHGGGLECAPMRKARLAQPVKISIDIRLVLEWGTLDRFDRRVRGDCEHRSNLSMCLLGLFQQRVKDCQ